MKPIVLILFLLIIFSETASTSHAALPALSIQDAELLLNNIKKDRDAVLQDTFEKMLEAYDASLTTKYPAEVLEFMAFCSTGKLIEIWEDMSPDELSKYSEDESKPKRDDERIATECWNELQEILKRQKGKSN